MATIRHKVNTYAITIPTFQRTRHFQKTENAETFLRMMFDHRDKGRFQLHGFVIMPDHVHVLITPAIDQSTARCIQFIKGGYSFAVRSHAPKEIWQTGYFEHRIRDEEDYWIQLRYIANNPTRRQYQNFPYVHTRYARHMDPMPQGLKPLVPIES